MITYLMAAITSFIVTIIYSLGPMKLAVNLLGLSLAIMALLSVSTGTSWFPLIFTLLFTGGVLMIFIILSSFLPNEKSMKLKVLAFTFALPAVYCFAPLKLLEENTSPNMVKCALSSNMGAAAIIAVMLLYFMMFLEIIYTDKLPMRSSFCQSYTVL